MLERIPVDERDGSFFDASFRQLDELFLLVVAGEFNSGKSAFINSLLGKTLLEEGVTPTTARITIVRHGETERRARTVDGFDLVEAPFSVTRSTPAPRPPLRFLRPFFVPFLRLDSETAKLHILRTASRAPVPVYFRARRSYDFLSVDSARGRAMECRIF